MTASISAGSYILSALALAVLALSLGFTAYRLRRRLLPTWTGAPARLVESILAIALLIWLSELLGLFGFLYAWTLVASSLLLVGAIAWLVGPRGSSGRPLPAGGAAGGTVPEEASAAAGGGGSPAARGPAGPSALAWVVTVGVVAVVFAHWGLTAKDALDRGIFNFDSLWYHMPFAAEIAQSHSVTGLHYTDTVFVNWLYPQNSELLHAVGILLIQRDTLSLFLNFGFLAIAFLAAWCIGRPYGRGHLTVVAAAVVLECHTLVVREPGAAKNDLMAAALLLAAAAILVNAWAASRRPGGFASKGGEGEVKGGDIGAEGDESGAKGSEAGAARLSLPLGWPLAAAGLAAGLAVGTKSTALAMAAALSVAAVALAPVGRRWAAAGWWSLPALAAGGFWYLRNLIVVGNPLPQLESLGPISLPHPERLQTARPDFSVAHYATDTAVWRDYFAPGLHDQFGLLWPLVIGGAIAGGVLALARRPNPPRGATSSPPTGWTKRCAADRIIPWIGVVALLGMLAYLFTPLTAAGAEGAPVAFDINIRYAIPGLLLGLALLPLARAFEGERRQWALLAVLLVVLVLTNRADAVLRDPDRVFALALTTLFVLVPAGILIWRLRPTSPDKRLLPGGGAAGGGGSPAARGPAGPGRSSLVVPMVALVFIVFGLGYFVQRDYLRDRFANRVADTSIPGFDLDSAYRWARGVEDARIGLAGTTTGFLQYGFYGTDLSNRVVYLGEKGPKGAFNAIQTCSAFRAAVNAERLDYLVTAPFLNFIRTERPIRSPEPSWLRGEEAVTPIERSGPVTVWRVGDRLDPGTCGPANAPLRRVPDTPKGQSQ